MSALFRRVDWNSRVAVQAFRWFYCREDTAGITDFAAYLLHKAMSEHADAVISAPDKIMPDMPEKAAQVFADLEKRLAPWGGRVPPLVASDEQALADGAEYDALPENHWHESGRWMGTPRSDMIWDRVKKRIAAEAEADGTISAADKRRMARQAKHMEAMRDRAERKRMKEWEPR
jgi:hypothetical protein